MTSHFRFPGPSFLDLYRAFQTLYKRTYLQTDIFSLEENQKLTQMGRLTSSIRFVDVSEKECQVSIDEYYTVMVIKRDSTPTIQINLNNIKSAKILPKVLDIT